MVNFSIITFAVSHLWRVLVLAITVQVFFIGRCRATTSNQRLVRGGKYWSVKAARINNMKNDILSENIPNKNVLDKETNEETMFTQNAPSASSLVEMILENSLLSRVTHRNNEIMQLIQQTSFDRHQNQLQVRASQLNKNATFTALITLVATSIATPTTTMENIDDMEDRENMSVATQSTDVNTLTELLTQLTLTLLPATTAVTTTATDTITDVVAAAIATATTIATTTVAFTVTDVLIGADVLTDVVTAVTVPTVSQSTQSSLEISEQNTTITIPTFSEDIQKTVEILEEDIQNTMEILEKNAAIVPTLSKQITYNIPVVSEEDIYGIPEVSAMHSGWLETKDAGVKGNGLFTTGNIKKNSFLGEYVGEVLTYRQYVTRYPEGNSEYTFLVCEKAQRRDRIYVDAVDVDKSNLMRYVKYIEWLLLLLLLLLL